MLRLVRGGFLTVAGIFVLLVVIGSLTPAPKCGEVGYYPKLSAMCRAAGGTADGDRYCSADELRDIKCAAATYADNERRDRDEMERELTRRTY